ncbi:MAG TPA: L,D-transpeptidase [Gaiellaceae bacterium]|nr:L,D-transpeptidase [Gaiellaceae bacterium]
MWGRRLLVAVVVAAVLFAAFAAAAFFWSGATLSGDPVALARLKLQPLAGSVRSLHAVGPAGSPVPLRDVHGRLTPTAKVEPGEHIRVDVVIRRSRWIGWLAGRTRHETLTVTAPVTSVVDRWPSLSPDGTLAVRFTTTPAAVLVGGKPHSAASRTVSLGKQPATGTIRIAAAARPWERPGAPVRVSWFPKTPAPAVQISPAPSAQISALAQIRLTFAQPVGSARPHFTRSVPGHWSLADSHTLVFHPGSLGFGLGTDLELRFPDRVTLVGSGATRTQRSFDWTVASGSLLRLYQLLAQEAYLPVVWNPTGADVPHTPAAEIKAAIDPPQGTFSWRFPNTPSQLTTQWNPTTVTQIERGAVMQFEHEHNLTVDAIAGPQVWRALIADAIAGKRHSGGYSYVYVHTSLPQLMTLWHDGKVILTSPGNTGIPAAPTAPGTFPVFEHIPVGEMKGTNPDGSHYDDKGIRWISYFHGGEALHSFNRASFGTPQSLGCVELPLAAAAEVWPYTPIGTLVTIENPS